MTNQPFIVYVIVFLLFCYIAYDKFMSAWRRSVAKRAEAKRDVAESAARDSERIERVLSAAASLDGSLNDCTASLTVRMDRIIELLLQSREAEDVSNKFMAGTIKACASIATSAMSLSEEVTAFRAVVSGGDRKPEGIEYPEDNIIQPGNHQDDDKAASVFAGVLRGLNWDQAAAEAEEDDLKKTMISAADLS